MNKKQTKESGKWNKYEIDYEYGFATLFTKIKPKDVLDLFHDLANQCFGIRKSIGEVKLTSSEEVDLPKEVPVARTPTDRHPDLYRNPLSVMFANMGASSVEIPDDVASKAKYILTHSGDMIAWSSKNKKITSEFDD